jgi:hypothetical protein
VQFENGMVISVQFGAGNYCDNYDMSFDVKTSAFSSNAEIAVFNEFLNKDNWRTKEVWKNVFNIDLCDDVAGRITADDFAKIVEYVSKLPKEGE